MLEDTIMHLIEDITQKQKQIMNDMKTLDKDNKDKEKYRKLDKQLNSILTFSTHLIKFKQSF